MNLMTSSSWNPLDFLVQDEEVQYLDLGEVHLLGQRTSQVASRLGIELTGTPKGVIGREVGDDRVDLSSSPDPLCAALAAQEEVIHMVTSWPDTSVRKKSWNFCEVTGGPLTDPQQGYDYVRKRGDFSNLGFNDSIILRIIIDAQKGDGDEHSSTQPGKMSMLGSRLGTPRKENRGMWMLASMFQDSMLCTHRASEPKYLPQIMGGTGVTALFDNSNNVFLYVLAYKGGKYRRIYATACAEMRNYLYDLEREIQTAPILCPRLREKQEYFWGTYDHMVFVPKGMNVGDIDSPPMPLYEATGGQNRYQNFENRLIRTRHLVSRKNALTEWAHTRRLRNIFHGLFPSMESYSDIDKSRSQILRARFDGALSANTALQNLLRREAGKQDAIEMMGNANFLTVTSGRKDFTREDAEWVYLNGQGENYSLQDVTLSEDMFVREEVSAEETFKVGGIPLRPYFSGGPQLRPSRTKVGLYQINSTMEEWSEDLLHRLMTERGRLGRPLHPTEVGPIFDVNREWVNDDRGLISQCHRDVSGPKARYIVVLVSGDRRLANKMAETCNVTIIRLDPREFVRQALSDGLTVDSLISCDFLKSHGYSFDYAYVDTGSISAVGSQLAEEDGIIYRRTLLDTGWRGDSRFSQYTLSKVNKRRLKSETHHPVTRPKIFRSRSRPMESVYSSHESWRQSVRSRTDSQSWRSGNQPLTTRSSVKASTR